MSKVYFASNWGISSKELLDFYKRQTPGCKGVWDGLEGTKNIDEADYIIVQDNTTEDVDIGKVIFFGREPRHVMSSQSSMKWQNSFVKTGTR